MDYPESQSTMLGWTLPKNFPWSEIPLPEATDQTFPESLWWADRNKSLKVKLEKFNNYQNFKCYQKSGQELKLCGNECDTFVTIIGG